MGLSLWFLIHPLELVNPILSQIRGNKTKQNRTSSPHGDETREGDQNHALEVVVHTLGTKIRQPTREGGREGGEPKLNAESCPRPDRSKACNQVSPNHDELGMDLVGERNLGTPNLRALYR